MHAIGSFLIIVGLAITAWQYAIVHGKEVAEGRVTAIENYGGARGGTYRLVASFTDRSGAVHSYRAAFGMTSTGYRVGERIRIYFDRDNPADCGVLSFGYRFGIGWSCMVAGLALWFLLAGWAVGNRGLESLIPTTVPLSQAAQAGSGPDEADAHN